MSWPVYADEAPITYFSDSHGLVLEGRVIVLYGIAYAGPLGDGTPLTEENRGIVWAPGWGTKEAIALRVAQALATC